MTGPIQYCQTAQRLGLSIATPESIVQMDQRATRQQTEPHDQGTRIRRIAVDARVLASWADHSCRRSELYERERTACLERNLGHLRGVLPALAGVQLGRCCATLSGTDVERLCRPARRVPCCSPVKAASKKVVPVAHSSVSNGSVNYEP